VNADGLLADSHANHKLRSKKRIVRAHEKVSNKLVYVVDLQGKLKFAE
jgi:hypothetical protein